MAKRLSSEERGQALVIVALAMMSLIAFLSLVIDGGMAFAARRQMYNAADAAALAGTRELRDDGDEAAILSAVHTYAQLNGVENPADNVTAYFIDENLIRLPSGGECQMGTCGGVPTGAEGVEVMANTSFSSFFAGVIGRTSLGASGNAAASISTMPASPYALLALDPSECRSCWKTGSGDWNISGGVKVNSDCSSDALRVTGSGDITASAISVKGGYMKTGSGTVSPTPDENIPPVPDPLESLKAPVLGDYPISPSSPGAPGNPDTLHITGSGDETLEPGVYYGGIQKSGSGNVTLNPGVYILAGGGLDISGSGNLTGSGVFFYNTEDPDHPYGDGGYGSIEFTGSGSLNLTPMGDGDYKGLLFFQDRSNDEQFKFTGSSSLQGITGTVYVPAAHVQLSGSGNILAAQFICNTFKTTGSRDLIIQYDDSQVYGIPQIRLTK